MFRREFFELGFSPSLFDKLFDDHLSVESEQSSIRRLNLEELKASVSQDLEALLNTRRSFQRTLDEFPEVQKSILNFGILDFVGYSSANPADCDKICKEIAKTIEQHDNRLKKVSVEFDYLGRRINALSFNIKALLIINPTEEPISFDAVLHPSTQQYKISMASHG